MNRGSRVIRVPNELIERMKEYEKTLSVKMKPTDLMRNFAENAIMPRDSFSSALGRLNNASKKR
jgi:hypothetical protein